MDSKKIVKNHLFKIASSQEEMLAELDRVKSPHVMVKVQLSGSGMKSHTIPGVLAGPVVRDLLDRHPSTKIEGITLTREVHIDLGGSRLVMPPMEYHLSNMTVKVAPEQVDAILYKMHQYKSAGARDDVPGHPYYKIHGGVWCLVLTPAQFEELFKEMNDPDNKAKVEEELAKFDKKREENLAVPAPQAGGGISDSDLVELTDSEKELAEGQQLGIEALRAIRGRTGCSLGVAKRSLDVWRKSQEAAKAWGAAHPGVAGSWSLNEKEEELARHGAVIQAAVSMRDRGCPSHEAFRLVKEWLQANRN